MSAAPDPMEALRLAVLERHKELVRAQEVQDELAATLDALEEVTAVPRREIEAIAQRVLGGDQPDRTAQELAALVRREAFFPPEVRQALARLEGPLQEEFLAQYALESKSRLAAFLFALLPPPLSAHHLYLGRWWVQIPYSLSLGGCFLWWLVDLFRTNGLTYRANREIARRIYHRLVKSPPSV